MSRAGRAVAALALAGLLASPAAAKPPSDGRPGGPGSANPSALVAMEIAFARMAAEKGQWTAFRKFAADAAVMFAPQPVPAKTFLKGRKDPPKAVAWQPYQVWMSCDGSLGVTKGAWQRPDGSVGYFTTAWARQKDGGYRWTMDQGDTLAAPLAQPDFLEARVADCRPHPSPTTQPVEASAPGGTSRDGTLAWQVRVAPDGARTLTVKLAKAGRLETVLETSVAAGG